MSELAKSHIEIIDESSYGAGSSPIIPLYVFATEQDKVVDETTGEIAAGTAKSVANEVIILTSRKDVTDTYGVPYFTTVNGTVQQGDELNEVGLYGLYDALGNASLAYAIRADIDLKQLKPMEAEPRSKVKNQTLWFDLGETSFGLFRANDSERPALAWEKIEDIKVVTSLPTSGEDEEVVLVIDGENYSFYEYVDGWKAIGSTEWKGERGVEFVVASHTKVPSGKKEGSIWLKTTEPNYGAKYLMKQYNSTADSWKSSTMPVYASFVEAEKALGSMLNSNSIIVKCETELAKFGLYQFGGVGLKVTVDKTAESIEIGTADTLFINGTQITITGTNLESLIKDINRLVKTTGVRADNVNGHLVLSSDKGHTFVLDGTVLSKVGLEAGMKTGWETPTYRADEFEPTDAPKFGTLWFNDDLNVDIMVNNGNQWVEYDGQITKSSEKPENANNDDLWINTASANYPEIYRHIEGNWILVDNTDQSTPDGIVFADARSVIGGNHVDPDCPKPETYPSGILLFNTRYSTNNVKEYKENPFEGLYDENDNCSYQIGAYKGRVDLDNTACWVSASGNAEDGSGLFGRKAQRRMIVRALAEAIKSNEDIRSQDYDFFFACCPGYPELDDELVSLNADKKEMFYIVTDTPARLSPKANDIQAWATNKNNAPSHGEDGRIIRSAYMTRQYPSMGLTSNVDGLEVAVPTSIAKMKNLLTLPRGMFAAGTQYGQVKNLASVGYINSEEEYATVTVRDGLGELIVSQSINPIMPQRNTGLLFWGESTENSYTSSLSDEHAILTILRLKRELEAACLPFFFQPNTDALRKDFDATLRSILNDYVGRDELYDYVLVTDRSVNTNERIERKELWAEIAIEIVKGVEQIYIPIRIVKTGSLSGN